MYLYPRSTMTQNRLNSVAACNVHQKVLMSVSTENIVTDFVSLHSEQSDRGPLVQLYTNYNIIL